MNDLLRRLSRSVIILFGFICLPFSLHSQGDLAGAGDAFLISEMQAKLEEGLVEARPYILELVNRLGGTPEGESYVFLAALSFQEEHSSNQEESTLRQAVDYYNRYLDEYPDGLNSEFVRFNLANAYSDLDEYDEAIKLFRYVYQRSGKAVYRTESRNRMAALYIRSGKAAEGIPLFLEVFSTATLDPELRAQAAVWLIQGYLAADQTENITGYLRYLAAPYEAVFDPAFNITLVESGDALFEQEDYDKAILLYSFVKKRDDILQFYQGLVRKLRRQVQYLNEESDQFIVVDGRLKAAEARLEAVREIRAYDVDLMRRIARVYKQTDRTWESLWAFFHLYEDFPEHENVEDFLYTAYGEAVKVGDVVMAERLALDYLAEASFQKFRGLVTIGLAQIYADAKRHDDLMPLVNGYLEDPRDLRVGAQLVNVVNNFYVVEGRYLELRSFSEKYRDRFPKREPLFEATRYWAALGSLLLADYPIASEAMATFIRDYPKDSVYYEDTYYRYAVALLGEQKETAAEAQFLRFTDTFPASTLRGEAELYLGDLKRGRNALSDALVHYRSVEKYTQNSNFIAKGIFALAEVLEEMGQPQQAIDELKSYAERFGKDAQLAETYSRIGLIFDRLGRLSDRFSIHTTAIRELISDASSDAVDALIESYITDHRGYTASFKDSRALLQRLIDDADFRDTFLTDRAYQYQYMISKDGIRVDKDLAQKLVRDREFRAKLITTKFETDPDTGEQITPAGDIVTEAMVVAELQPLVAVYEAKLESIADYKPVPFFYETMAAVKRADDLVGQMRAQMALDQLSSKPSPPKFTQEQLALAPPAVILWEADKRRTTDPEQAKALYQIILDQYPYSDSVYDALIAIGDITYTAAMESGDQDLLSESLAYYNQIIERFAMRSKTAIAHLRRGQLLVELGRQQDAIDIFGQIIRNPMWKGMDHAKAHLELGRAYRRQGQLSQAHGFFERLIVAYGGFAEPVAWAYYYDMLTLEDMGETESLNQLIEEYRTRVAALSETEAHTLINEKYDI